MVLESVRPNWRGTVAVVAVVATGLLSCTGADTTPDALDTSELTATAVEVVTEGACRDVFGAEVCTWATFSGLDVAEFGVTIPLASVENAPETMAASWPPAPIAVLALPDGVRASTGFTHFELNWEHHGHPPQTFMEPHFDLHFYTISSDEISKIDCKDVSKPETLPPGFALPDAIDPEARLLTGLCVPSMGMHAMRDTEIESSEPFTATTLIGYYSGDLIFVEPMVSRATLMEAQSFSLDIPSLAGLTENVRYPTRFDAEFDPSSRTYRMVLSGLVAR